MTPPTPYAAMAGVVTAGLYVAITGVVREGTRAVRHSVVFCRMLCVVQMTVVRRGEFAIELNLCFMLMSIFQGIIVSLAPMGKQPVALSGRHAPECGTH